MTTPCDRMNLGVQSYNNGVTWWGYRCLDCREHDVLSSNWWQPVADMIREGDIVIVSGREWGCIIYVNTNTFQFPGGARLEDAAVTVLRMGGTPL